jgi:hypothetical protein
MSDYRVDDRVRYPAEAKDFSSNLCVQTISAKGTGYKARPITPPNAEVKNEQELHIPFPLAPGRRSGTVLLLLTCVCLNVIRIINSRRKTSAEHLALMGEMRNGKKFWFET